MGSGKSVHLTPESHVVIVGGGFGGLGVAKNLKGKANFTVIDGRDGIHYNIAATRAAVEPGVASVTFIPYSELIGENFKQGVVTGIDTSNSTVTLQDGQTLRYTHLVLATGTTGPFPGKVTMDTDTQEAITMYDKVISEIKASKSIVVVGGGAVGVELAGDIATEFKGKQVTLIHSQEILVDSALTQKAQKGMMKQLQNLGVKVCLGERVSNLDELPQGHTDQLFKVLTSKGNEIDSDLMLKCTGAKVNSSAYHESLGDIMNELGQLKVNEYLQVKGYNNIYAVGDCTDVKETKMAHNAEKHGEIVAKNLLRIAHGKEKKLYKPAGTLMVVSIGRNGGVFQSGSMVFGSWMSKKIKSEDMFLKKFYNDWGLKIKE
ncbi:ferroptosis suppressor protein 1-like [Glandiceps talaboti]